MRFLTAALIGLLSLAAAPMVRSETYFQESFDDKSYTDRWVASSAKKSDQGAWGLRTSDWYGDKQRDQGLATTQDAKFYFLTSKLDKPLSNKGKDLVLQFSVKHPQKIDCGGGYIKLLPPNTDQENFNGDSQYNIMFGPDICGTTTKKVHVIFNYKGENKLIKKEIPAETDQLTHVYTLIVKPDQTYEVRIDGTKKESGSLLEDWDFLPAKTIKDPNVSKPKDWVDEAQIDDPEDKKPEGWDDIPKQIPDPEATKPDDWDDEADGEWEAPQIDNPEYKGEWKAKKIANPAYKGKWVHPEIPNPAYVEDDKIYAFDNGAVGFDLWQVKAGTIFDNIIVTDDISEAESLLADTYSKSKSKEKEMFDAVEKTRIEKEEAERKKAQEEADKAKQATAADDDDEEEEDEDEEDEKPKKKGKAHDEL